MAIQFPPSIQLDQDPYVKSRAGFNTYLDFVKEQKERVTSVRMMAQQKKLLGEQRKEKLEDMSVEYYLRGINERDIQAISGQQQMDLQILRGQQSMAELKVTEQGKLDSEVIAAYNKQITAETEAQNRLIANQQKSEKEAADVQKQVIDEYGDVLPYAKLVGFRVGVDMDSKTGLYQLIVPYGDKTLTQQDLFILLNDVKPVSDFVKTHEDWQNKPGEKIGTQTIGNIKYLGSDEESQTIMSILRNPNHPDFETFKNEVKSGILVPAPSQVEGTADVVKARDELRTTEGKVDIEFSNMVVDPITRSITVKKGGFFSDPLLIDFNKPISVLQKDIAKAAEQETDKDEKTFYQNLNRIITEYAVVYKKSVDPENPDITSFDDLYFDPVKKRININKNPTKTSTSSPNTLVQSFNGLKEK